MGCGWYGFALAKKLTTSGFSVKGSTTSMIKFSQFDNAGIEPYWVLVEHNDVQYDDGFFACDLLIISIPPKRRSGQADSYTYKIERIRDLIIEQQIGQVLFISSTSVYGDHNMEVTENTIPIPDTDSGKAILAAENLLKSEKSFITTVLRFGGLYGPERDPARFFAGRKNIANGKAPVNMIHLNDCIQLTKTIIEKEAFGHTFNCCSPLHPTKSDFYTQAAIKSKLELPEFTNELGNWKIVSSDKVAEVLNYSFTNGM